MLAIGVDSLQHPTELAADSFSGMLESVTHRSHPSIMADNVQEYGNSLLHVHTPLPFLQLPMLFQLIHQMIEQVQCHVEHVMTIGGIAIPHFSHVVFPTQNASTHWALVIMSLEISHHLTKKWEYNPKLFLLAVIV